MRVSSTTLFTICSFGLAPSKPSSAHIAGCSIAALAVKLAQLTNRTVGGGVGGSFGIGASGMGLYGSLGLQIVADPFGNAGLVLNGGFSFVGIGTGALGRGQASLSTSKSIAGLSGPTFDPGGSYGPIGVDVAFSPGGTRTGTLTVGAGIGEKVSGIFGASGTGLLTSTNCKGMVP